jgi:hypothetical protein
MSASAVPCGLSSSTLRENHLHGCCLSAACLLETEQDFVSITVDFILRRFLFILHWTFEVKVKLSLCLTKHHAMKTYWGSGDIAPHFLDLGTRWR